MKYLYGDATPFPLDENFIETLLAATDACVSLLRLDAAAENTRRECHLARMKAGAETSELDAMAEAVESALARHLVASDAANGAADATARKVQAALIAQVKQARIGIARRRDAAIRKAGLDHTSEAMVEVLGELLCSRELPDTTWRLRWKATAGDEPTQAHLHATANPIDLQAVFEVDVPEDHQWRGPVRVSDLCRNVEIMMLTDRGWLRGGKKIRRQVLDKYWITEVEVSPERKSMTLTKKLKGAPQRIQIQMETPDSFEPTVRCLDADAGPSAQQAVRPTDTDALQRLWDAVGETIADLMIHRKRVILANLEGKSIREIERPADVAEAILESIGPLTREMRRRSRVPGEITLKIDLGDGRREELFIPKQRLAGKFAGLSEEHRRLFDIFGLDGTAEIVTTERPRDFPLKQDKARVARGTDDLSELSGELTRPEPPKHAKPSKPAPRKGPPKPPPTPGAKKKSAAAMPSLRLITATPN